MSWLYDGNIVEEFDPVYVGFVYIIENKITGRKYIGKKLFNFRKTKTIKGKKKKFLVESDWKQYFGSNTELNEDVVVLGEEKFERRILKFCCTKGECNYWEAKFQFDFDVLLNPTEYYNSWIMVKVRRSHLITKNNK